MITVAIGTLVYSFASTAFGGFGSGFSNLVSNAGQQLSETLVPEQAYFFTNSTISCVAGAPQLASCGGVLYVRNTGLNPIAIQEIYMTNITAPGGSGIATVGPVAAAAPCASNNLAPDTVCFANFNTPALPADHVLTGLDNILPIGPPQEPSSSVPPTEHPIVSSDATRSGMRRSNQIQPTGHFSSSRVWATFAPLSTLNIASRCIPAPCTASSS